MKIFDPNFIIAHMPGYVYWKNKESRYMGCNHNLAVVSGLKNPEEIIGKTDYDFAWGKEQADRFIQDDQLVMQTRQVLISEYQLPVKRSDGNYLYVRTEKMPFYNDKNEIIGVLAIAVDITDQKLLEEKILTEKKRVEMLSQAKTEFIRNMEHDLRTPFSAIYSLSDVLYLQEKDEGKKEALKAIRNSTKEILDFLNSIVDFSRMESGSLPLTEIKFDLKELLDSIVAIEEPAALTKRLELLVNFSEDVPSILIGDVHRVYRVLLNLISNAIKFTEKGFVKITIKKAKETGNKLILRFYVEDTGIGIPADKQDEIFEKFTRVSPAYKGMHKGTGLGLSNVRQFMEEMGGELELQSEFGKGSIFACTIPFILPIVDELAFQNSGTKK